MGDDVTLKPEMRVPPGVIAMVVRVEHKLEFPRAELLQGRFNLTGERRKLIVHDQDAVRPDGDPNVPSGTRQHVNMVGDLSGLDFDFGKILLSGREGRREEENGAG